MGERHLPFEVSCRVLSAKSYATLKHIFARALRNGRKKNRSEFYVIIRRLCLHTYVFARREKEVPQTDDFRTVDLERSGGLSQCQQVQGHAKSCQQQEHEE